MSETDEVRSTIRLPKGLHQEISDLGNDLDRSFNWVVLQALTLWQERQQRPTVIGDPSKPLDDLWAVSDHVGKTGHTYEATVAFALPAVGDRHDEVAYDIRDALIQTVIGMGARDPVTRLVSLCGMKADARTDPGPPLRTLEPTDPA